MKSALADYLRKSLRTWANYATTETEKQEAEHFKAILARGELEWSNTAFATAEAVSFATAAPVNTESNETPEGGADQ